MTTFNRRLLLAGLAALPLSMVAGQAFGQAWPSRTLIFVVPGAAGGTTDIPARLVAQKLSARLGQPVVVENRPGTGGVLGVQALLAKPADGYTVLVGNTGANAINYSAYRNLSYKPEDLVALTDLLSFPNVLVVNAQSGPRDLAALVQTMKAQPGRLSFASAGVGQSTHLTGELFKERTGTFAVHVPYRGSTPATMSVIAGETNFLFDNLTQALPHIRSGKLRALAVTSAERMPSLPEVPTLAEAGVKDFAVTGWLGFFAAAKTPPDVLAKLHEHLAATLRDPEVVASFRQSGGLPGGRPQTDFANYVESERKLWGDLIRNRKLALD